VNTEHLEASLPIISVKLLGHQLKRYLSVPFGIVNLAALFLNICQFIVIFCISFVLVDFLNIVVLRFIKLARQQMHISLIFNISHHLRAILIVYQYVFFVSRKHIFGLAHNIKNSSVFEMDVYVGSFSLHFAHLVYVEGVE